MGMRKLLLASFAFAACTTSRPFPSTSPVPASASGAPSASSSAPAQPPSVGSTAAADLAVVTHHNSATRNGLYVMPGLTADVVAQTHLVGAFDGTYSGAVNAQPLYMPGSGGAAGQYFVVTERNYVVALDEVTGLPRWQRSLGPYANQEGEGCGGFNPLGVTGTPVIDPASHTLYVDGVDVTPPDPYGNRTLRTHLVHAISTDDGTERDGWPVDVASLVSNGHPFHVDVAHQRGALALVHDHLFVPYGSQGDCGDYYGTVVSLDVRRSSSPDSPTTVNVAPMTGWASPGPQAGVWAPNGVASDGTNVFFATGNGGGDSANGWQGGEAVYRFAAGVMGDNPDDVFVSPDWAALDAVDGDLGGSGVVIVSQPGAAAPELALAFGKDGNMYALDATNLGGAVGTPPLMMAHVATHDIVDSPAAVPFDQGTLVVFDAQSGGAGVGCPAGQAGDLVGVYIAPGSPPTASVLWCNYGYGHGAPIITTTDGVNDPLVWMTGGGGDGALHAYDAGTGQVIYDSSAQGVSMPNMYRFNTLIASHGRLLVAADNHAYQFAWN